MQLLQKHIIFATALGSVFLFTACAPESKYNGGSGALHSYESLDAYGSSAIKYRSDYTKPSQSSFNSTLVANDRDNIQQSLQNSQSTQNNREWQEGASRQAQSTQLKNGSKSTQTLYESPVQGDGGFTPTQSLLGGMRDSEAIQRATMRPYTVRGKTYRPHPVKVGDTFDGVASWYGPDFHAKATSNGETYNMYAHTAANKTLPINTIVKVYNKDNGKTTVVRINDRGPFVEGRIIDLSNVAAHDIAMVGKGIANVRIEVVGFGGNLKNSSSTDSNETTMPKTSTPRQPQETKQVPAQERSVLKPQSSSTESKLSVQENIPQESGTLENYMQKNITGENSSQKNIQQYPTTATTKSNKEAYVESLKDGNANDYQSQPTQANLPQASNETGDKAAENKEAAQDKNVGNNNDMPSASEEDLPLSDTPKPAQHVQENSPKEQAQTDNEALESVFTSVTPKRIDNTEALKDIDAAMQKLKDSTDDIAKKVQEDRERRVNESKEKEEAASNLPDKKEAQNQKEQPTHTKQELNVSQNPAKLDASAENKQNVGNFMVSLNVFSHEDRAKHFQNESRKIIQNTPYTIDIVPTDKGLYRVAVRGFKTHDEAKAFIERHDINGHVVQEQ